MDRGLRLHQKEKAAEHKSSWLCFLLGDVRGLVSLLPLLSGLPLKLCAQKKPLPL